MLRTSVNASDEKLATLNEVFYCGWGIRHERINRWNGHRCFRYYRQNQGIIQSQYRVCKKKLQLSLIFLAWGKKSPNGQSRDRTHFTAGESF